MFMGTISCGNEDEPSRGGDGVFTVNSPMINHIVNLNNGDVLGMSATHNKLTIDTSKHQASVELTYNDGSGDKTVSISGITATPLRLGFYSLKATHSSEVKDFSGYVDFNESSIRYCYTTNDGIRVVSTIEEVFFLKTQNTIEYDDTTEKTVMEGTMYQFNVDPSSMKAIVKVMGILHAKDWKYFINITGNSIPVTLTKNGYIIAGENIKTNATYRAHRDSTNTNVEFQSTDKYPFKTFNANVDMANDHLDANFMMGSSATVTATGRTYPDYTAY